MQLKTDKCNFIHLGRCVKSAALNIPHDSPWLIFPWSETPIISHRPNSTRMAQCSPRGQFSGHLPLTHHSCGNQPGRGCRDGRRWGVPRRRRRRCGCQEWMEAYLSGEEGGELRRGKKRDGVWVEGERRQGVEWVKRGRWRTETGKARVSGEEGKIETKRDWVIQEHFNSQNKKKIKMSLFFVCTWIQKVDQKHNYFIKHLDVLVVYGLQYSYFLLFYYSFLPNSSYVLSIIWTILRCQNFYIPFFFYFVLWFL